MRAHRAVLGLILAVAGCGEGHASRAPEHTSLPSAAQSGATLARSLGCRACHAGLPAPDRPVATPLAPPLVRNADSLFALLRPSLSPSARPPGARPHPDFHLDDRETTALLRFLGVDPATASRGGAARDAARRNRDVLPEHGERLFAALNCGGCHVTTVTARPNGPPLGIEGSRVRPEWLRVFLRNPRAIRPFGVQPGDGGRMPDFALTNAEADSIAAFLETFASPVARFEPRDLTPFARQKTEVLLHTRLSCLGCHALDGQGGRIGPDLTRSGERLTPAYIRAILEQPDQVAPGTIMPKTALPVATLDLLASHLAGRTASAPADSAPARAGYLSLIAAISSKPMTTTPAAVAAPRPSGQIDAAALYATYCAACHGTGRGDGFNAAFLRARPADHTDARAISVRPDDVLYDAIAAGGFFLGKSAEMPAFGSRLEPAAIRALVAYIRRLCACTQPDWAADGDTTRVLIEGGAGARVPRP